MYGLLFGVHILVCLSLVGVILIQSGKGGGLAGGAFGGATQTVFGGRGATDFITRATIVLGALFFLTSVGIALLTTRGSNGPRSIVSEAARRAQQGSPATVPGSATGRPGAPVTPQPSGTAPAPVSPAPAPAPATPAPATPTPAGGH